MDRQQQPIAKKALTDWDIEYRLYRPSDSENCIALEHESLQKYGRAGIGSIFNCDYDQKCCQFPDHIIIVAQAAHKENLKAPVIIGAVCLGIKDIYLQGEIVKAGALFDLRVSQSFQGTGVASNIMKLLQETAVDKGCQFIYLSVNSGNKVAISLYNKFGYGNISERVLKMVPAEKTALEDRNNSKTVISNGNTFKLNFARLENDKGLELTSNFYNKQDLALVNMNSLFSSNYYVGTYAVSTEDQENIMGISLFRFNNLTFFGLREYIVSPSFFANETNSTIILSLYLVLAFLGVRILGSLLSYILPDNRTFLFEFLVAGIFFALAFYTIRRFKNFLSFILVHSGFRPKGRYIAPFCKVKNEELQPQMFQFLLERMGKVSSDNHMSLLTYNCDKEDKFWKLWCPELAGKGLTFTTFFMGKYVGKSEEKSIKERVPTENLFFDPRDM